MNRPDRSSRAVRFVTLARDAQRWPPVAFHHPRRRDANHAPMPAFAIHYHAIRFAQRGLVFKPAKNADHDAPLFFLTLGVQLVVPTGNPPGTLNVFLL